MDQIHEAGIKDIGIVVSPENRMELNSALGDGSKWESSITYIVQSPPLGLAHAVKVARDYLDDSNFLLFLGDNLIKDGVRGLIQEYYQHKPDALGVAEVDNSGRILRVIEKPKDPPSNLALVGAYIFTPVVHEAIDQLKPSWRGEYEITDAIQKLLEWQKVIKSHILEGWWLDTGKKEDLLEANRIILEEYIDTAIKGEIDSTSKIIGRVEVMEGSKIENCFLKGPVSIGPDCRITDSFIGPFVSIGEGTEVTRSRVEKSIILNNSRIVDIPLITDSVIGRNVEVIRQPRKNQEISILFLGDHAQIEL
jgi:glucose-1-phosphate thymidylyltransferase